MNEKASLQAQNGVMVAFYPPPEIAAQLAIPGGEAPQELHLTLCFLGTIDQIENPDALRRCVAEFAAETYKVSGTVSGIGRFSNIEDDGTQAFYASFDSPDLPYIHHELRERLEEKADVEPANNHGFTPHITLAYISPVAPVPLRSIGIIPITFDKLSLVIGGERFDYQMITEAPAVVPQMAKAGARHSMTDIEHIQHIHDKACQLGAKCAMPDNIVYQDAAKTADDTLQGASVETPIQPTIDSGPPPPAIESTPHNALKAISKTDDELRVANHLILFYGRDLEGVMSTNKNADGSTGEFFTPQTRLESDYTAIGRLPVDWEHGRGVDGLGKDDKLGYVDWKTARVTDYGVWVERVLFRRNKYVQLVEPLIKAGLVGSSSEPVPGRVSKKANGEIEIWPLRGDALTVTPMDPRMLMGNTLSSLKALALEVPAIKSACQKLGIDTEAGQARESSRLRLKAKQVKVLIGEK